jgi:geranylgeranyl diphosphate synthase type I
MNDASAFDDLRREVARAVDGALDAFLGAREREAEEHDADTAALAAAVRSLALRGGKRLRAALVAAAYEGYGGEPGGALAACVAIELLQAYLLIHDDVMDGDETRRGGPSVHAMLASRFGSARAGEVAGILAGDLASAFAQDALLGAPQAPARVTEAARELARMQRDVVYGQLRDTRNTADSPGDVEDVHALKTASYTVRGPLLIGAALSGAPRAERDALERFARPLGVAFQLKDDLLGVFGDPARTGKPLASDLREGKRTALVVAIAGDPQAASLVDRVLGVTGASDDDVAALVRYMESSGAKARVETRLGMLMREALDALPAIEVTPRGRAYLAGAARALTERDR